MPEHGETRQLGTGNLPHLRNSVGGATVLVISFALFDPVGGITTQGQVPRQHRLC